MSALIGTIIAQFWPYILAGFGVIAGLWTAYTKGQAREKAKQAAKDLAAAQDRIEMNREANTIEQRTAGLTDDQARKEAAPWVRK